ncbi:nucleotidyl transferase AbiEii/AbiGii toxin family protein [Thermomonospora cellulosilytica]|uniref:Nucleotidyltransferase AbiEii toxin of type IV toxin-antitoxin system n=1 Tax=Thermomonospora cellulosilytica TaxID=1411118 RepID=A0A7W3R9V8_9ACTN|nr:nucleotidyl transferase AbiEii/AbiGii toxin family protein [Thermomonospora cellulosilytica]MBA9005054.1 hypothetical protein [Thermomonospora cellulosilytica]
MSDPMMGGHGTEPGFVDPGDVGRWRAARRAVLNHVLGVMAESAWANGLVLRGSMAMLAWVGEAAREPADLDWVLPAPPVVPVDALHPYPYVDSLEVVQQWPEAADGAAAYEIWRDEEFDTGGLHPVLPPEGLHYVFDPVGDEPGPEPYRELIQLLMRRPEAAPGVFVDPAAADWDGLGGYYRMYDTPGVRLMIPWHAEGLPPGRVQLDFARDEWLPEAPVPAAVPRGDGGEPSVVPAAGPALSLAWKLLWLHTDWRTEGRCQGKDLYDAVLLAEADRTALSRPLLDKVFRRALGPGSADFDPSSIHRWKVDWRAFQVACPRVRGTADEWLGRLHTALAPVFSR